MNMLYIRYLGNEGPLGSKGEQGLPGPPGSISISLIHFLGYDSKMFLGVIV